MIYYSERWVPVGTPADLVREARDVMARIPDQGSVNAGAWMGHVGDAVSVLSKMAKHLETVPGAEQAEVKALRRMLGKMAMKAAGIETD